MDALLVLEDGRIFPCKSFTGSGESGGEIVFNTSMSGYQEIVTDPSYYGQMITMTYPMIGSCGVNFDDNESNVVHASAFLIKEYQSFPSNFRSIATLGDYLKHNRVLGVEGLDTRALTRHIRQFGSMRAVVSTQDLSYDSLISKVKSIPSLVDFELISKVTTVLPYRWGDSGAEIFDRDLFLDDTVWNFKGAKKSIVVFDYGLKISILRNLVLYGFEVVVVPADTDVNTIEAMAPDGVLLSNGPGDPSKELHAIETVRRMVNNGLPIFGVCLGHQILAHALGATTFKLKFGHRGGNQPVKSLLTGKVEITAQNHGFAIDVDSMTGCNADVTHINLNDNTIEGIRHRRLPVFSVQYHPEASPGPRDSMYLFNQFKTLVENI